VKNILTSLSNYPIVPRLVACTIRFIMSRPPIELLPPELLAHVFDNLAKDCRAIQNVRLVYKVLRDLSSHHLITRVVLAERQKSLDRTRWIMDHEFFRKHVTHVVWDVSQFQESLAYDLELYKKAWAHSPGSWPAPELQKLWREDRVSLAKMLRYEPREEPGLNEQTTCPKSPMRSITNMLGTLWGSWITITGSIFNDVFTTAN
jgi:hypothetical protein